MLLKGILSICSLILLIISCSNSDLNKSFQLSTTIDTTRASIGDLISYKVLTHNIGNKYFDISKNEFSEPLELRNSKLLLDKKEKVIGAEFILSVWDTGKVTIPSMNINIYNSDSTFDFTIASDSIVIEVVSLVDITGNQRMKPLKGPLPIQTIFPLRIVSLFLLLSIIVYGLYYFYGKRLDDLDHNIKSKPNIEAADKIAFRKLDLLIKESENTQFNIKEFYVDLSYILREYVENTVYIKSLEMTTEEIIRNKVLFPFNDKSLNIWIDILNRADLSKYAKSNPNKNVCRNNLDLSKNFITETTFAWKVLNE